MYKSIIFGLFFTVSIMTAASFDCQKASTVIEKTICQDTALNLQDEKLGHLYQALRTSMPDDAFKLIKRQQRLWMRDRDSCEMLTGIDRGPCLQIVYGHRVNTLHTYLTKNIQEKIDTLYDEPKSIIALAEHVNSPLLVAYSAYIFDQGLLGEKDAIAADKAFMSILDWMIKQSKKEYADEGKKSQTETFASYIAKYEYDRDISSGVIDSIKKLYQNDKTAGISNLLFYLYFVGATDMCIPNWAVEKELKGSAVGTYGGYSSIFILDKYCPVPTSKKILKIPSVDEYYSLLGDIYGNPGAHICAGSMEYSIAANKSKSLMKAALVPSTFLQYRSDVVEEEIKELLGIWSSKGVWNHATYARYKRIRPKAINDLAEHYSKLFTLEDDIAQEYAKAVIYELESSHVGRFSNDRVYGPLKESKDPLYRLFLKTKVTIEDLKGLGSLDQKQLDKTLKLLLLTDQDELIIKYLLAKGAKLDSGEESALFFSLEHESKVRLLIENGADVEYENCFGKTALYSAIQIGNAESIKTLLDNGASLEHKTYSIAKLTGGDHKPRNPRCKDTDCLNISTGLRTPLMYACWQGSYEVIDLLLHRGANPISVDQDGNDCASYLQKNRIISDVKKEELLKRLTI